MFSMISSFGGEVSIKFFQASHWKIENLIWVIRIFASGSMTSLDPNCLKNPFSLFFHTNPIKNEYFKPINGAIIWFRTQTYQKKNEQVVSSNNVTVTCFSIASIWPKAVLKYGLDSSNGRKNVYVCVLWHRFFVYHTICTDPVFTAIWQSINLLIRFE